LLARKVKIEKKDDRWKASPAPLSVLIMLNY
jgi:hypothetical protein